MSVAVFDPRPCQLGEGAMWHPGRQQAFWFDILGKRLLSRKGDQALEWQFNEHVSAAGWLDDDHLLIASETALFRFDLRDGTRHPIAALEAGISANRSNDGRADPMGGFWIGTMAKDARQGAGAIYRWFRGELRQLRANVSIPNAICFSPDATLAYFADTAEQTVWRQALDAEGWPVGTPQVFLDLRAQGLFPDGAITDAQGRFWNAQWGAGRLACYGADGAMQQVVDLPSAQTTCPAFIGPALDTLLITSAATGLSGTQEGLSWQITLPGVTGSPVPKVLL